MLIRWLKFNAVGAAGIVVQVGALWMLVELGHLTYLSATVLATELAVLHNFLWHTQWTWADRPASVMQSIGRLVRFSLSNGAVSLVGNAILMAVLTGHARIPYLEANLIAIAVCSIVNFVLSETLVFGPLSAADLGTMPCHYGSNIV
jgi:putative flippase GtrA